MKRRVSSTTPRSRAASSTLAAVLISLSASCATILPEPEVEPAPPTSKDIKPQKADDFFKPPHVHGVVLDGTGSPVKARIAVVSTLGGSSYSAQVTGAFKLSVPKSGTATLVASTADGRLAWKTVCMEDPGPHTVVVNQRGGFLNLELARDRETRVAVFHDGVRLHDVTLRPGKPANLVVPVGEVEFSTAEERGKLQRVNVSEGQEAYVRLD